MCDTCVWGVLPYSYDSFVAVATDVAYRIGPRLVTSRIRQGRRNIGYILEGQGGRRILDALESRLEFNSWCHLLTGIG
jgi:hypothetical protein